MGSLAHRRISRYESVSGRIAAEPDGARSLFHRGRSPAEYLFVPWRALRSFWHQRKGNRSGRRIETSFDGEPALPTGVSFVLERLFCKRRIPVSTDGTVSRGQDDRSS